MRPVGGLPVGLQIMAPALADERCYRVGAAFEAAYTAANGAVLTPDRPDCRWHR